MIPSFEVWAPVKGFEDRYEVRIFRDGELPIRTYDWHDLFNLLVWLAFPRAKAAINARHYRALLGQQQSGTLNRGPAQDALTLFDESGVVVLSGDADLLQDVRDFAWKQLFWRRRERVRRHFRCIILGHALYEKALQPFVGITGHAILFEAEQGSQPSMTIEGGTWETLDARLAARVSDETAFLTPRELAPLPLVTNTDTTVSKERVGSSDQLTSIQRSLSRSYSRLPTLQSCVWMTSPSPRPR